MKLLQSIIPLLLLIIISAGCTHTPTKKQKPTLTVITGVVKNLEVYPNTKEFVLEIADFRGKKTTFKDSIKPDGTFRLEFDLYKTQDITLNPIVGKMVASPGDSIQLQIDFKDIGNIEFWGNNQKSNTGLNKFLNSNYSVFNFSYHGTGIMDFSKYKSFCDSIKNLAEQKRQEFINETNPSPEIIDWTKDHITISYQKSLLDFPFYLAYKTNVDYHDLNIPIDYYNFLDNIENAFSETIINTEIYEWFNTYTATFYHRTINDQALTKKDYYSKLLNALINNHKQSYLRQMLVGYLFYTDLTRNNIDFFSENRALLENNVSETSILNPLKIHFIELQKQKKNLEINSNAILSKLEGTAAESLIDSIWSINQGKVIYLDFWGTWCGPCIAEMPNSKKLKHMLAGKNIEFVYLCVSSKEEQWKQVISQMQIEGQHYYCDNNQSISIRKAFNIEGIPYYMLVNKNGHIVESGNYLRPMIPETIKKINNLLHEK